MNLFSEIYNCYYQVTAQILKEAASALLTGSRIQEIAGTRGYQESALSIVPHLVEGDWDLLDSSDHIHYRSKLQYEPDIPLTALQKSWLKALLSDDRITLFFSDDQLEKLQELLKDITPLFHPSDFDYFDCYRDGDPVRSVMYRQHFRTILHAIRDQCPLRISYYSAKNRLIEHVWLPCRMEYSSRDGKFRLCAFYRRPKGRMRLDMLNIARILSIRKAEEKAHFFSKPGKESCIPDVDHWLEMSLSREPVVLEITNERNALERTMLHFASYQKNVERLEESGKYRCSIFYDRHRETELLIQVLSFGPMVKVIGPPYFRRQIKERIDMQKNRCLNTT